MFYFQDAARYGDELKEIAPHSLLKCSSDATTLVIHHQSSIISLFVLNFQILTAICFKVYICTLNLIRWQQLVGKWKFLIKCSTFFQGIRVEVRSVYIEGRSQPSKGQYFFAYRIRITNNSTRPIQLLRRHWIITDANGKTENVWWELLSFFINP